MPFMSRYDPFSPKLDNPLLNSSPDFGLRNGTFRSAPIGAVRPQSSYRERFQRIRDHDQEKIQLIEDILAQLDSTQAQLRNLQFDPNHSKDAKERENTLQDQLRQHKDVMTSNAFITALVDGDGNIFPSDLLTDGELGGKEAANLLQASLTDFVDCHLPELESYRIVVKVYADVSSLADILLKCREINAATQLQAFIRGFNSTKLLFDFIDVGPKKDATGDKISEMLRMNLQDCHCRSVLIGCSHNDEYAAVIREVANDTRVADKLTLLEGIPFEPELAALQPNFKSIRFDQVFQSTKLVPPRAPMSVAVPVLAKIDPNKSSDRGSAASTPQMNWATVTAQAHAAPLPNTSNAPPAVLAKAVASTSSSAQPVDVAPSKTGPKLISFNNSGQRIDRTDPEIANYEIQRVKKLKLCNSYYLQGQACTSSLCSHRHDYPISNHERKVLREVARMTPCYYRTNCTDAECIYGHRCPQSEPGKNSCYYGKDCRFHGWGHGIDTKITKTTKFP